MVGGKARWSGRGCSVGGACEREGNVFHKRPHLLVKFLFQLFS